MSHGDGEAERARLSGWSGPPLREMRPAALRSAVVFSSPHSGRRYPESLLSRAALDALALRASEDAFVDELFAAAPEFGAPLIAAEFPRAFVDANRAEDELDPALIYSAPPRRPRSLRVVAGLGVVPRVVAEGRPIYRGRLHMEEALARIAACHRPYHDALEQALRRAEARFGGCVLVDCHSMPSECVHGGGRRPEIVIGDCFGVSCGAEIADRAAALFRAAGFRVARNAPFAGGHITHRYGRPSRGRHAVQIEIDRGLYMDERRVERGPGFAEVRAALRPVIAGLAALSVGGGRALAAE